MEMFVIFPEKKEPASFRDTANVLWRRSFLSHSTTAAPHLLGRYCTLVPQRLGGRLKEEIMKPVLISTQK